MFKLDSLVPEIRESICGAEKITKETMLSASACTTDPIKTAKLPERATVNKEPRVSAISAVNSK